MDARPGRDEALSRLFEAHYADTVRLAFYLTGSWPVAEDLAQEAFVRLWRRWGGLRDHHAALGYLRTTVVNLSRSALRRRLLELRHQQTSSQEEHEVDPVARLDIARALARDPDGTEPDVDVGEGPFQPDPGGDHRASGDHGLVDRGDRRPPGSAGQQPGRHAGDQHGQGQPGDQGGPPPGLAAQPSLQPAPAVRRELPA